MPSSDVVVKITTQHADWPLARQTPGESAQWGRYRFVINGDVERCDYWVVCEGLTDVERTKCPSRNTVLVTWEPPENIRPPYAREFIRQFGTVLTCDRRITHPDVRYGQQGQPWFVDRSYDALRAVEVPTPSRLLTVIASTKALTSLQRSRLDFFRLLAERFGNEVEIVGRGFREIGDKWDVVAASRYTVVVENAVRDDFVTEKLPDAYLGWAFPFYCGAPNVTSYFSPDSLVAIDVRDPESALTRIEQVLEDPDHYERALPALHAARRRYLDELQLFPMLASLLDSLPPPDPTDDRDMEIRPEARPSLRWRVRRKLTAPR
jgi:hypothetical protein